MSKITKINKFKCNQLKEDFVSLNPSRRKQLINNLNFSERLILVKIIKNTDNVNLNKNVEKSIYKKLKKVEILPIEIVKSNNSYIPLFKTINIKIYNFLSAIASLFNLLTARKANEIIVKHLAYSNNSNGLKKNSESNLKHISMNKLKKVIKEANKGKKREIDLGSLLESQGYSREIRGLKFSNEISFSNVKLEGITFAKCNFDWSHFHSSILTNVKFQYCNLSYTSFDNSSLKNCLFENCEMRQVMFVNAKIESSDFFRSSLIGSSFEDALITDCIFLKVLMPATHFLEAMIQNTTIIESNLKDAVFFGKLNDFIFRENDSSKRTAIVTKPTTAIVLSPRYRGMTTPMAFLKIENNAQTLPLRIASKPLKVDRKNINQEIDNALLEIRTKRENDESIPKLLIAEILNQDKYDNCNRILQKTRVLASEVDSFYLAGGEDIAPSLYGKEEEKQTEWDNDYRRSFFELCIVHQVVNKGIPLMGVCRGFQITNVYFGAQLVQNIKGHGATVEVVQKFNLTNKEQLGLYHSIFKNTFFSISGHHQAIPLESQAKEYLEPSVIYKKIIKAAEAKFSGSSPMILLQFHPEFYEAKTALHSLEGLRNKALTGLISKENDIFWDILHQSASSYKSKKAVLKALKTRPEINST